MLWECGAISHTNYGTSNTLPNKNKHEALSPKLTYFPQMERKMSCINFYSIFFFDFVFFLFFSFLFFFHFFFFLFRYFFPNKRTNRRISYIYNSYPKNILTTSSNPPKFIPTLPLSLWKWSSTTWPKDKELCLGQGFN